MQYLLLCCIEEARWEAIPESERDRIMEEYGKWARELKQSGRLLSGAKLDLCASAVTVRKQGDKPVLVDGPYAETKEQLGGYHVIECEDRDEAVSIALRIPALAAGSVVEVRPVLWTE
jgi:hypothetical protein